MPPASSSTASTGSFGMPIVRANTFVDPPGSTPSAVPLPAMPVATSFSVPSPPNPMTTSRPRRAASCAKRVAWPRRFVSTSSTSCPRLEPSMDDDGVARRHRRGERVDDEQDSQGFGRYRASGVADRATRHTDRRSWRIGSRLDRPVTLTPMNVIVCVKQIPDPALPGALDPSTNTLKRDGKLILDESDSYGVEMALQLVTAAGGGEVSLVSMAPNDETSGLRTALAMGAAKAVLVSDASLAGADALTTAKVLAAAVGKAGDVRPDHRRHRVERRLHRHRARADRRGARPALGHVRQDGARSPTARSRSTVRPRRATTRSPARCPPSCPSPPAWSSPATRASRASWPRSRSRSTPSRPPTSASRPCRGPSRSSSVEDAPAREAGEIIEDDGESFNKIVEFLENLKVI